MKTCISLGLLFVLTALLVVGCGSADPAPASSIQCTEVDPHPVAEGIAREFDVTYEEVMAWFCEGHPFDDILLALQTAELIDKPVDELLAMKEGKSWDALWEALGLVSLPSR